MPKTLDTQGFSGLREEVVRSEGRTSRSPVLQEIIISNIKACIHALFAWIQAFSIFFISKNQVIYFWM